jgi:hypothetical protein
MHLIRYPESFSANAAKFLGETQRNEEKIFHNKATKVAKTDPLNF